ncbi:MAG TPA: flagellin [Acidimicrobiales bacterium]|nr:flagellin [Acidimicrobiales bacterium]
MTSVNPGLPVVTNPATIATSMITNLERDQSSIAALETEVSTGFAVNTPADSPGEAANIVSLQASITRASQYQTNAQDGIGWLNTANSTMNSVIGLLQQVRSVVLGISSADLSQGQAGLNAVADQVTSSLQELVGLANTQYAGQAIFSGTGNPHAAYDPAGNYLGAGNPPVRTVAPGTQVPISATGPQVFGTGATGLLSSVPGNLGVLAQIVSDLQTGTPASVQAAQTTDLANLDTATTQVETQAAVLGGAQQSMQAYSEQATNTTNSLTQQLSSVSDVNMAQALTNLQLQQSAYQSALYATSQLKTDSIVQYL